MTPIQESCLIRLGLDRTFMGWYLVRRLGQINGTWGDLAASLGLTVEKMVSLAWCKAPRAERWDEDVGVLANYVGMDARTLAGLVSGAR